MRTRASAFQLEVKSSGEEGGAVEVEGFANKSIVDRGKDIIPPEAWKLDEYKDNNILLFNHNQDVPIGIAEVYVTDEGLKAKAIISKSDAAPIPYLRDMIKEGILKTFSVGFNPMGSIEQDDNGNNLIKSANLVELSVVSVPMNQASTFEVTNKAVNDLLPTWKTKKYSEVKKDVLKLKGAELASLLVDQDLTDFKEKLLNDGYSESNLADFLNGNFLNVDEKVLDAMAELLDMDRKELDEINHKNKDDDKEDDKEEEEEKSEKAMKEAETGLAGEKPHKHLAKWDDATGEGKTGGVIGEDAPHVHEIKEFKVLSAGADNHTHILSEVGKNDEKQMDDEDKKNSDFQECVNGKIPQLIEEGKEKDEAIAIAISACEAKFGKSCDLNEDNLKAFMDTAGNAPQEKQNENAPIETVNMDGGQSIQEDALSSNPALDQFKAQTSLLGSVVKTNTDLIAEIRGLRADLNQLLSKGNEEEPKQEEEEDDDDLEKHSLDARTKRLDNFQEKLDLLTKQYNL